MDIFVQAAGTQVDYTWRCSTGTDMPPHALLAMHRKLHEEDAALALVAGCVDGSWSVEFRHLLLPGVVDFMGRQVVFNICFAGLPSEKDVRALALAYLDFGMETRKSGRIVGHTCPELAACYKPAGGDYTYDLKAARAWAEGTLERYRGKVSCVQHWTPHEIWINPKDSEHKEDFAKRFLGQFALNERNGVRMLWSELYADTSESMDLIVRCSSGEDMVVKQLVPDCQPDPWPQKKALLVAAAAAAALGLAIALWPSGKKDDPSRGQDQPKIEQAELAKAGEGKADAHKPAVSDGLLERLGKTKSLLETVKDRAGADAAAAGIEAIARAVETATGQHGNEVLGRYGDLLSELGRLDASLKNDGYFGSTRMRAAMESLMSALGTGGK